LKAHGKRADSMPGADKHRGKGIYVPLDLRLDRHFHSALLDTPGVALRLTVGFHIYCFRRAGERSIGKVTPCLC
jgi:hypothetical protein